MPIKTTDQNQEATQSPLYKTDYRTYKQDWDKQRRSRNKKGNIETPGTHNMDFFRNILQQLNINCLKISKLTGISQQLLSFWMITDDTKLSNMLNLFDKMGMTLECTYTPSTNSTYVAEDLSYSIKIKELPAFEKDTNERKNILAKAVTDNCRLRFLAELIQRRHSGISDFCRSMNYQYFTVYQWFTKDDIKISRIYEIAKKTQQSVNWQLSRKEN